MSNPSVDELIAGKDRMIGELYSRCRALEEAYRKLSAEHDALLEQTKKAKS